MAHNKPLHEEEWPSLRDSFLKYWPHGVLGYWMMQINMDHEAIKEACQFQVYGNMAEGCIATIKKSQYYEVIIYGDSEVVANIGNVLTNHGLLDCSHRINVVWAPWAAEIQCLSRLCSRLALDVVDGGTDIMHYLSRDTKPYSDVVVPHNTYLGKLTPEHVLHVNNCWPGRYLSSEWLFTLIIDNGLSYALFSESQTLVAWMVINEVGCLTHLYCEEKYRRRGYAEYIVKHVSNDLRRLGKDPFCYVQEDNVKSLKLFEKLGFERGGNAVWVSVCKKMSEVV